MNRLLLPILLLAFGTVHAADRPNVLFIAIDDQNDWIGCLKGHPQALTPNIDALAERGTLFTNAHCQAPLCNPSRSSLMTGLRPSTTGIYGLAPGIRNVAITKDRITLPQTFTSNGYHTYTCGKIYHDGSIKSKDQQREFQTWGPAPGMGRPEQRIAQLPGTPHPLMDWGPFPPDEKDAADYKIASAAIDALQQAPEAKPFFIACGFRLPHVPCFAPQEWFDKFPMDELQMPPVTADDRDDTPRFSWYLHWKLPEPRLSTLKKFNEWKPLVRAYLASTAFMDHQVGRVLEALKLSGRLDNTIVVLWSDHGYHLGEKLITGKNTLWENSTRVPLIFAGPGIARAVCNRPVELLDIYPTLTALCDLPAPADLEGHNLRPLLKDASAPWKFPAITTHNQGNHSIRNERWRYIRYADMSEELYDLQNDPEETHNLAGSATHEKVIAKLKQWLPKIDLPPAPGSQHRVLTYDPKTGVVIWEGDRVMSSDSIPKP